jgi:hypothetical protein
MPTPTDFKKLTDPAIPVQSGTVATNDLIHTVDVSDTTSGAAGTSKRTTIEKLINVVQNNLVLPTVDSGTWTPTFGDFTGCVVGVTPTNAYYSRVNNIVTATITAQADLNFSISSYGYCDYDVPVATSFNERIGLGQLFSESVNCNIASNTPKLRFHSTSSSNIGSVVFTFTFQYEIN